MTHRSYFGSPRIARRGFTLVEMLLVIVIIGIVTAISVPAFVKSMRGNRRRMAARTVVAAGRYARSMAVMRQRAMALTFNLDDGTLSIAADRQSPAPQEPEDDAADSGVFGAAEPSPLGDSVGVSGSTGAGVGVADTLERTLDGVTITQVDIAGGGSFSEGRCAVVYQSNGRCAPYKVRIVDGQDEGIVIKVDALASAITVGDDR